MKCAILRNVSAKLAIFDVDGTLLRGDTACMWISRRLGNYRRMEELEKAPTREHVIAARIEMASWYSQSNPNDLLGEMDDFPWAPGVFEGISRLQANGVTVALASLGWDFVVNRIARLFGVKHVLATALDFETGEVSHVWDKDKAEYGEKLSRQLDVPSTEIAGVGDRVKDFDLLDYTGHGIYVGNDVPPPGKRYTHLPDADIRDVADAIISA